MLVHALGDTQPLPFPSYKKSMTLAGQGSRLMTSNPDSAQQPLQYTGTEFILYSCTYLCRYVYILNGRDATNIDFVGLPVVKAFTLWREDCRYLLGLDIPVANLGGQEKQRKNLGGRSAAFGVSPSVVFLDPEANLRG